jgi:hypothetical protein
MLQAEMFLPGVDVIKPYFSYLTLQKIKLRVFLCTRQAISVWSRADPSAPH